MASLSDEHSVYLIESDIGGLHIRKRIRSPTVCEAFNLHAKTETMTALHVPSGVGLHLFVRWLAIQGSSESGASAYAVFVTREHKSTNLTRVKRMR